MKNQTATKTVSRIVLAGLIVSMLPMNLAAKRPKNPLASWKTQRPSKESIDKAIKDITKLTKRLQKIKKIVRIVIAGITGTGVVSALVMVLMSIILSILFPPGILISAFGLTTTPGVFAAGVVTTTTTAAVITTATVSSFESNVSIALLIAGILTVIISLSIQANILTPITGGLTAAQIITPIARAKTLQNIEKKYPGILTREQIESIEKLYKITKGSITKGIVKGIRLKDALKKAVRLGMQKAPKVDKKTIREYITRSRSARNLQHHVDEYKEKIKTLQKARNKYSKLNPKWHLKNLKVIALKTNLKYLFFKARLKKIEGKLKRARREHSGIEQALAPAVADYIQKADAITTELAKELAKAITDKKKEGKKGKK